MVRIEFTVELNYEVSAPGADFIFNIHAARTARQAVVAERLILSQPIDSTVQTDPSGRNRHLRLRALPGGLCVKYQATVDIDHDCAEPASLAQVPVGELPPDALACLYPSRYCQSDRLIRLAGEEFGALRPGYPRALAIQQWVRDRVTFASNTSNSATSALDTLVERVGVCRDFAHLMIALCRAVNIPARFVSGTDFGADPALGPPDFHAYVEAYLGHRWVIFDPSETAIPMGLVRLGTGRDAADVAFATIFGSVATHAPVITMRAVEDPVRGFVMPRHRRDALSTDTGLLNVPVLHQGRPSADTRPQARRPQSPQQPIHLRSTS
jgi:transglutaminase-like putative cysteine protease